MKKSKHERVVPMVDRRTSSGGMYLAIDRREIPYSLNAAGGGVSKLRGDTNGKVKPAESDLNAGYDLRDLPCSDYERCYMV